ncbi:MAG: hypothetical protein HDS20_03660 [Bacteroides sp.]|nr:hypothetical protein [Bacteroides sp.]
MKKLLLSLAISVAAIFTASAAEISTLTLKSGNLSGLSNSASKTLTTAKGFEWTFSATSKNANAYVGYDNTKGLQIGSSNNAASSITITSEGFDAYVISKVTINTSGASKIDATVGVSVDGNIFQCNESDTYSLTASAANAVFEGNAKGEITISYTNSSAKAIYINSIEVEYAEPDEDFKKQPHLSFPQHDYYVSISKINDFVTPELDNPYNVSPVTFTSSNEDLALVDENSGEIALESTPGEVTITAVFAGNDEYEADEQEYVIHIIEEDQYIVTFDFEQNDYGMFRFDNSINTVDPNGNSYNAAGTKFGDEWVICTANEKTRLWWTGKTATDVASGKSLRVYPGGEVVIETPAGSLITNIAIYHYNDKGDAEDVSEDEDHEHVANIEENRATLAADWTSSHHKVSAFEVTYLAKPEVMNAIADAFTLGKHDNGQSHFTVKVNGVEQVSHSIAFSSLDDEPTLVSLSHYYPHATIYTKFEPAATPALYYDAAEGFTEHTEPLALTGSGSLSFYAEMNGQTSPVQTIAVTDTNTTSIEAIEAEGVAKSAYDLMGRKVANPVNGLYIINGKKVRI